MNHNKEAKNLTFWRGSEVSRDKVLEFRPKPKRPST